MTFHFPRIAGLLSLLTIGITFHSSAQWQEEDNGLIDTTLHIGDQIIVALGTDCVNAHSGPSVSDSTYGCVPAGDAGQIIDGPAYDENRSSDLQFWYVVYADIRGWCAGKYLHKTNLVAPIVNEIAASGTNLIAATSAGVFCSTNLGNEWKNISPTLTNYNISCLAVSGKNLFVGTEFGVFLSTNDGRSWNAVNIGLPTARVQALCASGPKLFVGVYSSSGVWVSTNNGASWQGDYDGLSGDGRWFAVGDQNLYVATDDWVYCSTNNGMNWARDGSGLPFDNYCSCVLVISMAASGQYAFVGTHHIGGGSVYKSSNNGMSWSEAGLTTDIHSIAFSENNVFAGGYGVVYLSKNNGAEWTTVNTGLPSTYVRSLFVSGDYLYAGTYAGIWKIPISEALPIQLASFKVHAVNRITMELSWTTVSEVNNYGFFVQESPDRQSWETVGDIIHGRGSTLESHEYKATIPIRGAPRWVRLIQVDLDGKKTFYESTQITIDYPLTTSLEQNYPNPFNPSTNIRYALPIRSHVTLTVFNRLGQQIATLVNESQEAGYHNVTFDGSGLASGVYLYRLRAGVFVQSRRLVLLK